MDSTAIVAIVGLLAPVIVGVIATCAWSSLVKSILMFVIAGGVGAVGAWQAGAFAGDIPTAILAVYGGAQVFYFTVIKSTGISLWLLEHFHTSDA
jgi:hypothetical protein